jgi:hypothetical protein
VKNAIYKKIIINSYLLIFFGKISIASKKKEKGKLFLQITTLNNFSWASQKMVTPMRAVKTCFILNAETQTLNVESV